MKSDRDCWRGLAVVFALGAQSLAAGEGIRQTSRPEFAESWASPEVNCHQGYATDGTNHYVIDTGAIYRRRNDAGWTLAGSNMAPFSGLSGIDHLGDGDYYDGKLYIVGERWGGCTNVQRQSILVFDAGTLGRVGAHEVSEQGHEVSGLAVAPRASGGGTIYVSSYCDGRKLFEYDLATFEYTGFFALSGEIPYTQGVTWTGSMHYAAGDGGGLYAIDRSGNVTEVYHDGHAGSHEGLKYVDGGIRWLIDEGAGRKRVHYLSRK